MKQVRFTNVLLSRINYVRKDGSHRSQGQVRTRQGKALFKLIGECIKAGGSVAMETYYGPHDPTEERANATLTYPRSR